MVSTETHGITIPKGGPDNVRDYSFLRAENDWVLGCHGYAGDPLVALDALEDWLIDELNLPDEIIDIPNSEQKYEEDMVPFTDWIANPECAGCPDFYPISTILWQERNGKVTQRNGSYR